MRDTSCQTTSNEDKQISTKVNTLNRITFNGPTHLYPSPSKIPVKSTHHYASHCVIEPHTDEMSLVSSFCARSLDSSPAVDCVGTSVICCRAAVGGT